jgi:hypothetical protein
MSTTGMPLLTPPHEKQFLFLLDQHKYVAFGGARGGGKSWAVRAKAVLLASNYPGIVIMIVRRSYPELRANHIAPMRQWIGKKIGKYNDSKKEYRFVNGSVILFRYCANERDLDNYQGTEVDVLFIDEATQFDESVFQVLRACVRGVNDFPKRIYLTCNPGGRGHAWVKRLFIDCKFKEDENSSEYNFIQSFVQDNKALMEAQPDYIKQLEALPPKLRDAWLYGKWDVFEGQFFEEFTDNSEHYNDQQFTHVVAPFNPPGYWRRLRSFDFGYAKPFSVGWWAVSPDGVLYRILELYGCTQTANEGVRWPPEKIFREMARIESEHPYLKGHDIEGIADPSIWDASRGISIADMAAREGIYFAPGDNARIPGWMQMHYRMAFDNNGFSMLRVFEGCKAFIRTIPTLIYSETKPEDLDTTMEDHCADEVRYLCMANPITARYTAAMPAREYNPLETDEHAPQPYSFFRI